MEGAWRELESRSLTSFDDASEQFTVLMRAVGLIWLYNSWCHFTYREGSGALMYWVTAFSVYDLWYAARYPVDEDSESEFDDDDSATDEELRAQFTADVISEAHIAYRVVKNTLLSATGNEDELFFFLESSRFHDWAGRCPVPADARYYIDRTLNGDRLEGHMWIVNGLDPMKLFI